MVPFIWYHRSVIGPFYLVSPFCYWSPLSAITVLLLVPFIWYHRSVIGPFIWYHRSVIGPVEEMHSESGGDSRPSHMFPLGPEERRTTDLASVVVRAATFETQPAPRGCLLLHLKL